MQIRLMPDEGDVMNRYSVKSTAVGLAMFGALSVPTFSSAQTYQSDRYGGDSVVVECAAGQRAVMEQRRVNGRTQLLARCERAATAVTRRSTQYSERAPRRTKTKTALMIAGSTATAAGVGGALKGKKGALIGAAIGGGTATIYEAAKRR
jgi:hypothetical protein